MVLVVVLDKSSSSSRSLNASNAASLNNRLGSQSPLPSPRHCGVTDTAQHLYEGCREYGSKAGKVSWLAAG
jgi:hypothetical protein